MASISATEDEVNKVLRNMDVGTTTAVAAINAQDSVVVSGPTDTVLTIKDLFITQGRPATRLRVSHAFHSPMMESVLAALGPAIRHRSSSPCPRGPQIPLVSTVTGKLVGASELTTEYWIRHVLAPVRFADALHTLSTDAGVTTFVEIGPSGPLANYVPDAIATSGSKQDEVDILLKSLGQLWVRGIQPYVGPGGQGWKSVFDGSGACIIDLPLYPFQRCRYWLDAPTLAAGSSSGSKHLSLKHASPMSSPLTNGATESKPGHLDLPATVAGADTCAWENPLSDLSPEQRHVTLLGLVQDQVAAVLGHQDRQSLPSSAWDTPFTDLGCDSFMGTLLRQRLGKLVAVLLPVNLTFNEATATTQALVQYLLARMVLVDVHA